MEFTVEGLDATNNGYNFNIKIRHGDKVQTWSLSSLGKTVVKTDKLFTELNSYLKKFSFDELGAIFGIYEDIKNDLMSPMNYEMIHRSVRINTARLLNYFDFDKIREFVGFNSSIPIPSNFLNTFSGDIVKNITRDKTYTRDDYISLIAIVIVFKALLPIFSEYIGIIKMEVGNEYKEFYVLSIIADSAYSDHPVTEKLALYIKRHLNTNFDDKMIVMKGINDEEFIELTVAKTIIRKLIISDLSEADVNHNLITYTYKFMTQKKKENEKVSNNRIVFKENSTGGEGENNLSTLEQFKLKQDVAVGDIVPLEYYLSDTDKIMGRLSPNIDVTLLKEFIKYSSPLVKEMIKDPQITMLQMLFKRIVSPRAILYLPKDIIIRFIAIGSTILWQNDLKFLALLLGSVTRISDVKTISGTGSRGRLSQEVLEELDVIFPYTVIRRETSNKSKTTNIAVESIDRLVNRFSDHVWYSGANYERIREATGDMSINENRLIIPHQIRNDLAKFVIMCNKSIN